MVDGPSSPSQPPRSLQERVEMLMNPEAKHVEAIFSRPREATQPAIDYFIAEDSDLTFIYFITDIVLRGDHAEQRGSEHIADPLELARINPGPRTQYLRSNGQMILEMLLARSVENFEKYLADLIRSVLRLKPQMLKSKTASISLDDVLKFGNIEALVYDVVERKVNDLAYQGFADLDEWCEGRGLSIVVDEHEKKTIIELIATRNIIAHNRGIVNERYLAVGGKSEFEIGRERKISIEELFAALSLFHRVVVATDQAARTKFKIPEGVYSQSSVRAFANRGRPAVERT